MASFSSGNDNFTASNSKQGNQSSFNTTQQAAITELENKTAAIANSLQDTINDLNDFKEETAADFGAKQDKLIPGSHVAINEANIISSNQINDSAVSSTETYSSDKIKSITDAIENKVNTKANISYVDTNLENISALIDTKQDKLTAGNGITISDNTISTLNYIDDNKPVDNKSYSSSKTVQLDKDVYNNLYEYINSANYDGTILRIDSDGNRFGSIIHAYSGITPGTYGTKDYADATLLPCFTINSEGHTTGVRLDEIYPPVTAGKTYDYWISNGSKRGNWQTPDSRPIDGSHNLITSGAVFTAVKHKGVFEAGLNIDISDYVISCTAIDNEAISDTKTFSSSKIQNDMQQLDESINNIEALIPAQATEENILADRDFVNSSINSVTAFYITSDTEGSPFATKAALDNAAAYYYAGTERVPTANDYCVVLEDETHENATVRYVYQSTETGEGTWAFQYVVNDTPFTSDQLAAINSGITAAKVSKYDAMTSVEHITTPHIDAQEHLYRNIELSTNSSEDIVLEDGNGNCTLIIYNNNSSDNVLKSVYGDEITVLGAHEFVVLMYSSGWKVVARQNNDTEKKIFITEAADPVNLTEQDDTHYVVQITSVDNIPIDGVILAQLPATAKDGAIYTITNISDRRLEVYTLVEPANSPFSTREDSVVIEMGGTMQFVYVARTPGWFVTTEARLSYYAYSASKADSAGSATNANHATTADSAAKATQDGSGNVITTTYVKKSGDSLDGTYTLTKSSKFIQNQESTSNYTVIVKWAKGGTNPSDYGPEIGQHNTGGIDGVGSVTILPYNTASFPWNGNVGLFIQKGKVSIDGTELSKVGHTHTKSQITDFPTSLPANGGTADKVASAGNSGMWIQGRANAICKTTSAGEMAGWKTLASIKTVSGSIEIGNFSGEDSVRVVYSSDADVSTTTNAVSDIMQLNNNNVEFPTAKVSNKLIIPIGAPSQLEDGCIWIG